MRDTGNLLCRVGLLFYSYTGSVQEEHGAVKLTPLDPSVPTGLFFPLAVSVAPSHPAWPRGDALGAGTLRRLLFTSSDPDKKAHLIFP